MRPLRLRARNLRTYPELDLAFTTGVVGILGALRDSLEGSSSNGSGKSTLLEAIDIALFGRRSLAEYLTEDGPDELMVELTFEHAGEEYRVRRTFSARGRGSTKVDLEREGPGWHVEPDEHGEPMQVQSPPDWEPLTCASGKETDAFLCELVGLSKETFRDSAYLRQGDGGYADPDRDPRQRKQLLIEAVLGRDPVWPRLADQAKQRRRAAETQIERHRGDYDRLVQLGADAPAMIAARDAAATLVVTEQDAVSAAEQAHTAVAARYQAAREQAAARAAVEAELTTADQARQSLEAANEKADTAARDLLAAADELEKLTTADQLADLEQQERGIAAQLETFTAAREAHARARTALDDAMRRRSELHEQARNAAAEAKRLRDRATEILEAAEGSEHCEMCKQRLGAEAAQEAALTLQRQAREQLDRETTLTEQENAIKLPFVGDPPAEPDIDGTPATSALAAVREQLEKARADQARRATIDERIRQLTETVAARPLPDAVDAANAAVAAKRAALDEFEPVNTSLLLAEGQQAREILDTARVRHTAAVAEKARCEERLEQVRSAQARIGEVTEAIDALQAHIDRDVLLERAYGRDGIPALIIENTAIPSIEAEASRILRALGTSLQVELRTQAETKSGGLRDTLDVVVVGATGSERSYSTYSGGEQTRIRLALQIALARLLANRRGAESRLLALDEPSYLDAAGMVALLDVLRGLDGEFDLILLVSHVAELRDALDETITVIKENGVSRIDGAPVVLEALAA